MKPPHALATGGIFAMNKPCKTCPFLRESGHNFGLSEDRLREIFDGPSFSCHCTVDYSGDEEDEDGCTTGRIVPKSKQCAGLMALLHRAGKPNQIMQVAERLTDFDPSVVDARKVYLSIAECVTAHATGTAPKENPNE